MECTNAQQKKALYVSGNKVQTEINLYSGLFVQKLQENLNFV